MPAGNQATLLNTVTLPEFTDLIAKRFEMLKDQVKPVAEHLFISDYVGSGQGKFKRYDEVDGETYAANKAEGSDFQKSRIGVGYNVTMEAQTKGKEIEITYELRHDNRYIEVGAMIVDLTTFCPARKELDLTHRLTFASSTSYVDMNGTTVDTTVGDGLALLSTLHTLSFSATTYSNRVPADPVFSQGAFEAAKLISVTQVYTNFGEQRTMDFNTIITFSDPATVSAVRQLLESTSNVDQNNPGVVNVYKGAMRHVILPRLASTAVGAYDSTKRKWWFIAATGQGVYQSWQAYVGEWQTSTLNSPAAGNNGEDVHNLNWTYSTYCRYGIAILSGRGLIGSIPTTA